MLSHRKIDQSNLAFESRLFAFGSSGDVLFALCLAHVYLGDFLSLRPDYAFTPFEHLPRCRLLLSKYRTGDLMAHATNDINSLTRLAGGGVMSAVDASITALVTLITMFFSISWQMTLVAVLPLPFMAFATSRLGRKTHKALENPRQPFPNLIIRFKSRCQVSR